MSQVRTDFLLTLCWPQFPHFLSEVRFLADWSCFRLCGAAGSASRWPLQVWDVCWAGLALSLALSSRTIGSDLVLGRKYT